MRSDIAGEIGLPDDLPGGVDGVADTPITAQRADVGHRSVLPEERAKVPVGVVRISGDLATRVDAECGAHRPAQRAEVDHLTVGEKESVLVLRRGD